MAPGFPGDHGQVAAEEEHWKADELDPSADRDPGRDRHHGGGTQKPDGPRSRRPARPSFSGGGYAPNGTEPGAQRPKTLRELGRRLDRAAGPDQVCEVAVSRDEHVDLCRAREREQVVVVGIARRDRRRPSGSGAHSATASSPARKRSAAS